MYFVFAWDQHYPLGGMHDCILKTPSFDVAINAYNESRAYDNKQLVDGTTGKVLYET